MKVMSIFGTRPEMIKMWSTLKKLDELNFEHIMVHTGQNFTPELRDFFFKDLKLRRPDYELDIDTSGYAPEVADVIMKSDALMEKEKPDALLILGDTYSGLSVLPAAHRGIKIFHMEAGLRAWDRRMPEQRNRILIDHISSILLPYNHYHRENLLREGIHPSKIIVTGNTTFEAMRAFAPEIERSDILARLKLEPKNYILVTAHRSENVDNPENLANIFKALGILSQRHKREVIFPMHPRTTSKLKGITVPPNIRIMPPLGFYDFNQLLKQSYCVLSDSGTAAEEGLFYKVPNVSLRMATERMETLESGATIVSGMDAENIVEAVTLAVSLPWSARYEFEEDYSPSAVVVNAIRTQITNFF
ncbi:UDP-N-acetylglucosamine 2-epimerase (non-hydrolyzing) [Bradyrhizobium lablabi]|uniref:non-hydrolyzing UDP-N-acetylglucosamine 2-epimerase n=1 Tax=Bradyrhizobium lablabi TaxID=722472 RepID=UPI001BA4A631|nr:UDP-N-acetylglucosamine 2-epimerase (non-hydrolyzing) [Bradyrhizobium lablabi]MBR1120208.1 UDP-N-acetylglucosamine 2-epimerase (non-hydrolyzing) [Bradyrhizobium lablabi]